MYELFINKLYHKYLRFSKFKGYIIRVCDGSIVDLIIVMLTREEFLIGDENSLKEKKLGGECSVFWIFIPIIF